MADLRTEQEKLKIWLKHLIESESKEACKNKKRLGACHRDTGINLKKLTI